MILLIPVGLFVVYVLYGHFTDATPRDSVFDLDLNYKNWNKYDDLPHDDIPW